ncbi:hypothetical protein [Shimia sp. SDUM112013]|uniref:hypothetical protein n=1 Tax=Shimia sp. SDUM112013 TaxID=3136160 RepID=UPI0032EEA644
MTIIYRIVAASAVSTALFALPSNAQPRQGWLGLTDGLYVYQGDADLSAGGSFSASRSFLRGGALYSNGEGLSAGVLVSLGEFSYDFSATSTQPWSDIKDLRVSVPIRFPVGDRTSAFITPQFRWDYEQGVSSSDGYTYGVFAGVAWQVSPDLRIGPAFGAFTEIGSSDLDLFPALLIDWQIDQRWALSTGTGLGATQGPGVSLTYAHDAKLSFSLSARYESVRFRLDNAGLAPGGVGEDTSIPVVLAASYSPNPGMSFTAFVGAELNGELALETAAGAVVSRQDYDTAPIAGLSFRVRF